MQGRLKMALRKGMFYDEDGEALVQAAQRSGGFPIIVNVQFMLDGALSNQV